MKHLKIVLAVLLLIAVPARAETVTGGGNAGGGASAPVIRNITSGSTDTATSSDFNKIITWNSATSSNKTETTPACSTTAWKITLVDEIGTAGQYGFSVVAPSGSTIQNAQSYNLSGAFVSADLICDGNSNIIVRVTNG